MASEITVTSSLVLNNGTLTSSRKPAPLVVDQATAALSTAVQALSTTFAKLSIAASVATPGWAYLRNLDGTNAIQIGTSSDDTTGGTFKAMLKLKPGEGCHLRLDNLNVFAKSAAATPNLLIEVYAD